MTSSVRLKALSARARVALILGSLLLAAMAAIFAPAPQADASQDAYKVCLSSVADAGILPSDIHGYGFILSRGGCETLDNASGGGDAIRVDVDPEWSAYQWGSDIDSYKIGHIDYGYGPCHDNSENDNSNPPDSYADTGARYNNYAGANC
jgi:hypothetical protein